MIGNRIAITVAAFAMMSQASVAAAASQAPARSIAQDPVGVASNRAALGLPIETAARCTPTDGVRVACSASSESSTFAGGGGSIFILLAAIAAIGLGIAAAASQSSAANSP